MQEFDRRQAAALYTKGWRDQKNFAELVAYLRPFIEAGEIPALLSMARVHHALGDERRGGELVDEAERLLRPDDMDSRVDLWSAYEAGFGSGGAAENHVKAKLHITCLAEWGNLRAQEVLLMNYLLGANGYSQDVAQFLHWATRAAEAGSELAREELGSFDGPH